MKQILLKTMLLLCAIVVGGSAWGQSQTITFDFEDEGAHRASGNNAYTSNSYSQNDVDIEMTYFDAINNNGISGSYLARGRVAKNTTNRPELVIGPIDITNKTVTSIVFKTQGPNTITESFFTKIDDEDYSQQLSFSCATATKTLNNLSITGTNLYLKWTGSVSSSTSGHRDFDVDDIVVTYEETSNSDPSISISPTSATAFTYIEGEGPSEAQSFTVTGANLTNDISLTLDDNSKFEISTTEGSGYTNSLTLTQSNGAVAATTVYVRLKENLAKGDNYTGKITLSSTDADNKEIDLSGSVIAKTYAINVANNITGGTISADMTVAEAGETVTLTANPGDAYTFGSWSVSEVGTENAVSVTGNEFTMPACAVNVTATFNAKPTYAINCVATPVSGGTVTASPASAYEGQTVTLTVTPAEGYSLGETTATYVDGNNETQTVSITNNNTFTMPAYPVTVTATFALQLDITYDFSSANNFYTTAGGSTHPGTGSSNNISEFYYGNGDKFTASGTSHYFGDSNNKYFLFGKQNAQVNLPTFTNYKITQIVLHSSSNGSTNVKVSIVSGSNDVVTEQTWSTKNQDYTYNIPTDYQTSALSVKITNAYNAQMTSIKLKRVPAATISSAEFATYVTPMDVDFTQTDGLTAYKAVSTGNGKVNLTKVEKAPAETPLVLNGSERTYTLQAATGTLDDVSDNLLAVSGNGNVVGNGNIYVLANIDDEVGFYQLADGVTLPANKVYLNVASADVKFLNFSFDTNEADGIEAIEKAGMGEGSIYDLQGRRLSVQGALPKGVYIVNGKKVMVK